MKRNILLILSIIFLASCNPFISKELRRKNKCNKKLERVTRKCPELLKLDTIIDTVVVKIPEIRIDTSFQVLVDTFMVDSLISELNNIPTKEGKTRYLTKYVSDVVSLDTTLVSDGVTVAIRLEGGMLSVNVFKPKETITVLDEDIIPIIKPVQLTIWDQIMNGLGKFFWWIVFAIALFILFRIFKNRIL
jgi:hypothetical protein